MLVLGVDHLPELGFVADVGGGVAGGGRVLLHLGHVLALSKKRASGIPASGSLCTNTPGGQFAAPAECVEGAVL
jgi:hypothetical protein